MGDVLLFQTNDGGEVEFIGGQPTLTDGIDVAAYLSMWGGNERDPALPGDTSLQWWGNIGEPAERQYRSAVQHLLQALPVLPANRQKVEDAVELDLAWMRKTLDAQIAVTITIPKLNTWGIDVAVTVRNRTYEAAFQRKGPTT